MELNGIILVFIYYQKILIKFSHEKYFERVLIKKKQVNK